MATPAVFPDIDFDLAIRYREAWKTLINQSEGQVEQRAAVTTRPLRMWTINCDLDDDADTVKDFLSARKGRFEPFLFRTRDLRSWVKIYCGVGDGVTRAFPVPFLNYSGLYIYDNGSLAGAGVLTSDGPAGMGKMTFTVAPVAGHVIEMSVTKGRIVPYVRLANEFYEDEFVALGWYTYGLQLIEVKEDIPLS